MSVLFILLSQNYFCGLLLVYSSLNTFNIKPAAIRKPTNQYLAPIVIRLDFLPTHES